MTREEALRGIDLLDDLEGSFSVFFDFPLPTISTTSSSSSSLIGITLFFDVLEDVRLAVVDGCSPSSLSLISATTLFLGALEDLRLLVAVDVFAGGASGSMVSSMMSCIVDRPRPLVVVLRVEAVEARRFGLEEDAERDFAFAGGLEDPEKKAHELLRFWCSSLCIS